MKTDAAEKRAFAADIANGFIAVLSERKRKGETRPSISFSCVLHIFYSPQFTTKRSGNVIYILTYLTIPRISHIPLIFLCLFLFLMFFFFNNRFKSSLFAPSILYYFSSFRCLPFLFSAYNFLNVSLLFFFSSSFHILFTLSCAKTCARASQNPSLSGNVRSCDLKRRYFHCRFERRDSLTFE